MERIFRLNRTELPTLAYGQKVLKAEDSSALFAATEIVQAAQDEAQRIRQEAEKAYARRYEQGYAEGLEAGKRENAEKVMETVIASVEFIEGIEGTVVDIVSQSIRKILGEMDSDTRIRRVVQTALNNVRGQQRVTVRVSPANEPTVSEALRAMTAGTYVTVVADPRIKEGGCILESDLGVVDASLETQLRALENAFHKKIGH